MAVITVLLAPPGRCDGVREILKDLSAADLISPFIWINSVDIDRSPTPAVEVRQGRQYAVDLDGLWTKGGAIDEIRLCVLVPAIGDDRRIAAADETRFAADIEERSGARKVTRIRFVITRNGSPAVGAEVAIEGWHNLLIAPEDSPGPRSGHRTLGPTEDPTDVGRYSVTTIASIAGLWSGIDESPISRVAVATGARVRLSRAFFRRLETSGMETELRSAVLEAGGTLPLPSDPTVEVQYAPSTEGAAAAMSSRLWTKHGTVLRGPREQYRPAAAEQIGLREILRMFFQFIGAAIKNAPGQWAARLAHSVSSGMASLVQSTVLGGDDSAFQVIVNGKNSKGLPASLSDVSEATRQIAAGLPDYQPAFSAKSDNSELWSDYVSGALTLGDGQPRASGLAPVEVGSRRAIMRTATEIVPGPRDRFTAIPGQVSAHLKVHAVESTDPAAINDLTTELTQLETQVGHGLQASETRNALDAWRGRHSASYGAKVGQQISSSIFSLQAELRDLYNSIRRAQLDQAPDGERERRTLARLIQIFLGLLVLIVAITIPILVWKEFLSWWAGLLIGVGLVVVVMTGLAIRFIKSQQELFQQLTQIKNNANKLEVDRANFHTALSDLTRLIGVYREYVSWSRALGAFLEAPLGPMPAPQTPSDPPRWGLPASMAVGTADPNSALIQDTAAALRRQLFAVGWLGDPWRAIVGAPFSDAGAGSGSRLDEWSNDMSAGRIQSNGAGEFWRRARDLLAGPMAAANRALLSTVLVPGTTADQAVPAEEFIASVGSEAHVLSRFGSATLTDQAITSGKVAVQLDVPQHTSADHHGRVLVTTQLSAILFPGELRIGSEQDADDNVKEPDTGTDDFNSRADGMVF